MAAEVYTAATPTIERARCDAQRKYDETEAVLKDVVGIFSEKKDVASVRDTGRIISELQALSAARHTEMLQSIKGARARARGLRVARASPRLLTRPRRGAQSSPARSNERARATPSGRTRRCRRRSGTSCWASGAASSRA